MSEKKRVLLLVLIMAAACLAVTAVAIAVLYRAAFEEQREVLVAIAKNHARLIEGVARFDAIRNHDYPGGPEKATLSQIIDAHRHFKGIGQTGEFTLGRLEGNNMVFLLTHRFQDFDNPKPLPMNSNLAEPMRRALLGKSGSLVGLDYRGKMVLAAHEPIAGLHWGIVAKVDLAEVRAPFIRAGAVAMAIAAIGALVGALLFVRITNPIVEQIQERSQYLAKLVASLQQSEKKLQNARDELEIRVKERTAELVTANDQLAVEVKVRTRVEERLKALWTIAGMINAETEELCDLILQGALQMTQSNYAFYGFLSPDESRISIYSWSREVLGDCRMLEKPIEYPIEKAGLWAEAIRQRRVIVVNDYQADFSGKNGIPAGHIQLTRIVAVPVFGHGRIVALAVAANKSTDYDDEDVKQLESFASGVQLIIDQRKMEEALRTSEKECRLLSRQVIDAQENERKRFAREIHDGIGQSLAAIKYRIESYALTSGEERDARTQELRSLVQMIRDTMDEVRKIQNDLRPAYLDMMGILETMSDFCEKFQATYPGIKVNAQIGIAEKDVPEYLKTPLFRIFQEAMNNAAKHSNANEILFSTQIATGMLELGIKDNGVGFDPAEGLTANGKGRGLGLFSMRERTELTGGRMEFRSAPGLGTEIYACWPLETQPRA